MAWGPARSIYTRLRVLGYTVEEWRFTGHTWLVIKGAADAAAR
jgi:hypothetical protein